MKAVAIILAAGEARTMPYSKALLEHEGGRSFLQSLASTFGKAGCRIMGVVGKDADSVREQHPSLELVDSERWQDGQLSSVKAGVAAALEEGADVVLLHPVDMPAVRASTLKTLLGAMGESTEGLRPEFEGGLGYPLVLSGATARRLLEVQDTQLESAVKDLPLRRIAVKDPGVIVNINTPEIDERLFSGPPKLAPPPKRRGGSKRTGAQETPASSSYAAASDE